MAYLSKDAYLGKAEYAAKHQEEQKAITTLTEEQHDLIAELCNLRHWLHCNMEKLYNDEGQELGSNEFMRLFGGTHGLNDITDDLLNIGLPPLSLDDCSATVTSSWWEYDITYKEQQKWELKASKLKSGALTHDGYSLWLEDSCKPENFKFYSEQHNKIEHYLFGIDENYGTKYAPTGTTRIY